MEAKFAVVIVFDDVAVVVLAGPREKLIAAAHWHGGACWKLVGGAHMGNLRSALGEGGNVHAVIVHIGIMAGHALGLVNLCHLGIAWIFYAVNFVAAKKLNQEAVEVFGTGANDDLLRRHLEPTKGAQMAADGLTQGHDAAGWRFFHKGLGIFVDGIAQKLLPGGKGEGGWIGLVVRKIHRKGRTLLRHHNIGHHVLVVGRGNALDARHKIAALGQGIHIALADQLGVGAFDGDGRKAKVLGQNALAWELFARGELASFDVVADECI